MAQRSFKLSDELDARLVAAAAADRRSVSFLIVRALEQALAGQGLGDTSSIASPRRSGSVKEVAPTEPPAPARASERTPIPKIAPRHWSR